MTVTDEEERGVGIPKVEGDVERKLTGPGAAQPGAQFQAAPATVSLYRPGQSSSQAAGRGERAVQWQLKPRALFGPRGPVDRGAGEVQGKRPGRQVGEERAVGSAATAPSQPHLWAGGSGGASGKEPTCQCRRPERHGFSPWVRKIPQRRAWQPTPVFLPGDSQGQRSLVGYSPWGHTVRQD